MTKIKNKSVYSDDHEYLQMLADELTFMGRHFELNLKEGRLTQLALPPQKPAKKKFERKTRHEGSASRETARRDDA